MLPFVVPKWQFKVRQEAKIRLPRATQQWRMTRLVALTKRIATAQQTSHSNGSIRYCSVCGFGNQHRNYAIFLLDPAEGTGACCSGCQAMLSVARISTNSCGTPHATACPSTCFHFHATACERCVQVLQGGVRRENVLATDYS